MRTAAAIALCLPLLSMAQTPRAVLDTTVIRIGEQLSLSLVVDLQQGQSAGTLQWPTVGDTLSKNIEVIRSSAVDTIPAAADEQPSVLRLQQRFTVTAFDSGFHAIPPFRFLIGGRSVETNALLLEVRSVPLDSATAVRASRDIVAPPFSILFWMQENWPWIAGGLALVIAVLLLWWRLSKRPDHTPVPKEAPPALPLHERVLSELRKLEGERIWQQGLHKAYHSRVTDLLRGYIEERYKVPALESTTDELVLALRVSPLKREQQERLENMLRLADMVKFAKATPSPIENEQMMIAAQQFVEDTADRAVRVTNSPNTTNDAR